MIGLNKKTARYLGAGGLKNLSAIERNNLKNLGCQQIFRTVFTKKRFKKDQQIQHFLSIKPQSVCHKLLLSRKIR